MKKPLLIGIALLSLTLAWADETEAVKKDLAALQGEWTCSPVPETVNPYQQTCSNK